MASALSLMFLIVAEVQKRVVVERGDDNDIAAAAAITAGGTASGNEFLATEREATIASVAGFYVDLYFVNEPGTKNKSRRVPAAWLVRLVSD